MKKKIYLVTLGIGLALTLSACEAPRNTALEVKKNDSQIESSKESDDKTNKKDDKSFEKNKSNVKDNKNQNSKDSSKDSKNEKSADSQKDLLNVQITKENAFDEFKKLHQDAKVESFKLETKKQDLVYVIQGYDSQKEYEFELNSESGEVVKDGVKEEKNEDKVSDIQKNMLESIDSITQKSLQNAGEGYVVTEYKLYYDDVNYIVEVRLEKDGEDISYSYDIATGKLLEKDLWYKTKYKINFMPEKKYLWFFIFIQFNI